MAKGTGRRRSAGSHKDRFLGFAPSEFKEHLSSMVNRGGTENPLDAATRIGVAARLPLLLVAKLDALAERLGENRTEALCRLIGAGWNQLMKEIEPKALKVLTEIEERQLKALIDEVNRR